MLACLRVCVALCVLQILVVLSFVPAIRLSELAEDEYRSLVEASGRRTMDAWMISVISLAAGAFSTRASVDESGDESPMKPASKGIQGAAQRASTAFVLAILRVMRWSDLAVALLAAGFAAVVDGLMVRRRRSFGFATPMPPLYNLAGYLFITALMTLPFLSVTPFTIPIWMPLCASIAAVCAVWTLCAHFPGPATLLGSRR